MIETPQALRPKDKYKGGKKVLQILKKMFQGQKMTSVAMSNSDIRMGIQRTPLRLPF